MNLIPFVLSVLIVLSYGVAASMQKHAASRKSQNAYLGLRKVERNILRQSESKLFRNAAGVPIKTKNEQQTKASKNESKPAPYPQVNPICSRLNLLPLLVEENPLHSVRYELAAKLLRLFYGDSLLDKGKRQEYEFLDCLLSSAKEAIQSQQELKLETIALNRPEFQRLYYRMLKGTKHANLFSRSGYPALIDYFKIERADTPICLFDAHPHMLSLFFGLKNSPEIFEKLKKEVKGGVSLDGLMAIAGDPQLLMADPEIWKLLELNKTRHGARSEETLVAEDEVTKIQIRMKI